MTARVIAGTGICLFALTSLLPFVIAWAAPKGRRRR